MTQDPQSLNSQSVGITSKMSFAVAGCAFGAAIIGLLVNQWLSGWMAVGGMTGVGLFYLAVGLLNLSPSGHHESDASELIETSAHRLSGAANVDDIAVKQEQEKVQSKSSDKVASSNHSER